MVEDADPEVGMDTLLAQASRNRSQTTNPPKGKPRSSISNSLIQNDEESNNNSSLLKSSRDTM